jgi:hypothetical protein
MASLPIACIPSLGLCHGRTSRADPSPELGSTKTTRRLAQDANPIPAVSAGIFPLQPKHQGINLTPFTDIFNLSFGDNIYISNNFGLMQRLQMNVLR